MIVKILIGLAALLVVLVIVIALQPKSFRVERSAALSAPTTVLFDQVNDHRKFQKWNPWLKMDPETKNTYSGPGSGVGAVCEWQGKKTGRGRSTIIESKPGELIRMKMDWIAPMQSTSTVDFTFHPQGDKTLVTWAMYGEKNFMAKACSLVMDCEKMCGPPFEKGLADLGIVADEVTRQALPAPLTQTN